MRIESTVGRPGSARPWRHRDMGGRGNRSGIMSSAVSETHTSTLFFVDDLVYKRKKPLDLGFSDFRDRHARLAACREEVRLNRRLAPDVYLGVAGVIGVDGQ